MTAKDYFSTPAGRELLLREYVGNRLSMREVARLLPFYATYQSVRRGLLANGIAPRSTAEATRAAVEAGRHHNPTKGRARTDEEREAIAGGTSAAMRARDPAERKSHGDAVRAATRRRAEAGDDFRERGLGSIRASRAKTSFAKRLLRGAASLGVAAESPGELTCGARFVRVDVLLPAERIAVELIEEGESLAQSQRNAGLLEGAGHLHLVLRLPPAPGARHREAAWRALLGALAEVRADRAAQGSRTVRL